MSESTATPDPIVFVDKKQVTRPTKRVTDEQGPALRLEAQIEERPTEIVSYIELIKLFLGQNDWTGARTTFDRLNERFPLMPNFWTMRLGMELGRKEELDATIIEPLLARCLSEELGNNDLSLWLSYLTYVRKKNDLITGGEEARNVVIQAFDVVVQKCASFEPRSSQFWNEYLLFLTHWKPVNKYEEQEKIQQLRKFYKTLLCLPLDCLERMWERYTQWEQEVNQLTARKFIGELSAQYMTARSVYQDWSNVTSGLKRVLPISLNQVTDTNIPKSEKYDTTQLKIWLDWINWESENKLELSEDLHQQRMNYVYMQACQHMCFAPEIWYNFALYKSEQTNSTEPVINLLKVGLKSIPNSAVLTFKLCEQYELSTNVNEIEFTFQKCIDRIQLDLTIVMEDDPGNLQDIEKFRSKLTYLYCIYMNTMKRIQGLSAARKIFGRCRKLKKLVTNDIYLENAYIEYYNGKDSKTSCKVLELGLKYFSDDGEYIKKYLDFLIFVNEDSQIRSVFETSLENIRDPADLKEIFEKMIFFESKSGNLNNVTSLEKRFFEKFPNEDRLRQFTNRYKVLDTNFLQRLELNYMVPSVISSAISMDSGRTSLKRTAVETDQLPQNKKIKPEEGLIPSEIVELLKVLPKRQYFKVTIFDPRAFSEFLSDKIAIP